MQNLFSELVEMLSVDDRLVSEGKLMKNKVVELALNLDPWLLKHLLKSKSLKMHFFGEVDGILIFDKIKFQRFVSNKKFLPDSFTAFKNKIGLVADDEYLDDSKEVVLAWPYKDCVLEGDQNHNDAKRDEVFWNETLAPDQIDRLLSPKVLTEFKKYDKDGDHSVETFESENLIIKGNNLLTLHTLKKGYSGSVDLIYIDPPYNPDSKSNTFTYNNKFNHSTWLTFMKNRLEISRMLLKKDGSLVVAIDENEQPYLGVLLREMFVDHEVHCITIVHNPRGVQGTNFSYTHEYAFFVLPRGKKVIGNKKINANKVEWSPFRNWGSESGRKDAKNCFYPIVLNSEGDIIGFGEVLDDDVHPKQTEKIGDQFYIYPIDKNGVERKWRYARQGVDEIKHLLRAKRTKSGFDIELGKDFGTYKTVWQETRYDANQYGTQIVRKLVPNCKFDFPKSLWNVYDCIATVIGDNKEAIVLDYFGGSGTTAHAVMELNKNDNGDRRFIICEQMHYINTITVPRVQKVINDNGFGDFVYCELAAVNQSFVDAIQAAKTSEELLKIWNDMQEKAFLSYRVNPKTFDESKEDFAELSLADQKKFLIEVLDKNMLYVPLSEIDDETYGISDADKALNKKFFG